MIKKSAIIGMSLVAALTTAALVPQVYAEPPQGGAGTPGGSAQGEPGVDMTGSVSHSGVMTFAEDMATENETYNSTGNAENAILMTAGTVTLTNPTINKTGSDDGDNSDFYGTNAAVFVSGGILNITKGTITTDGAHANGVFAYKDGTINISNATIKTTSNNSGAIMVTGGGTLNATYLEATTSGNSSAPIRSDRGGGTMNIDGGSYTSSGVGSPVIYSTANVNVKNAALESKASEGVVIEGKNSVKLENTKLISENNQLNGQSETYKGIFIYQSMSGDADEGVGSFTATDSGIITKNGDVFFITNTTAKITLSNNTFETASGAFLRAQAGKWGTTGANGGLVTLSASEQEMVGDIFIDNISTLDMTMEKDSYFRGAINADNTAKEISLHLSSDSVVVLTADSYITSLENADSTNSNIYGNGFKLYVNGTAVATNSETPPAGRTTPVVATGTTGETTAEETKQVDDYSTLGFIIAAASSIVILIVGGLLIARCMKSSSKAPAAAEPSQPISRAKDASEIHQKTESGRMKGPDAQ